MFITYIKNKEKIPLMPKISVLVAVYNTEDYLRKCLESLKTQTLNNIEIICVDDASNDASPKILKEYSQKDNRFKVIYLKENHGQAYARNIALKIVSSPLVCFLDSDDWFDKYSLEKIVQEFDNNPLTDCVLFHCIMAWNDHEEEYNGIPFTKMTGIKAFEASLTWKIHGVYAVRTSIHKLYPYDTSSHSYSDDNTTRIHYYVSKEVRQSTANYYYRQNPNSVTHKININRFDYLSANVSMKKQLISLGVSDKILSIYENVRWLNVIDLYMFYYKNRNKLNEEQRIYGLNEIRKTWNSIEVSRLTFKNHFKFGYIPFHPFFKLFRLEEELYFFLRTCLHILFSAFVLM